MHPRSTSVALFSLALAALCSPLPAAFQDHIGLQLWSIRAQFEKDANIGLDLVKKLGITEVETAGTANLTAEQFRAALDARGLKAVSAHVQFAAMEKDIAGVVRSVETLGAKYAICPWIPHQGAFDAATVKRAAENFNTWGAAFRGAGIKFGYHPHGYEFVPGETAGTTRFDELVAATDPRNVSFQLDVFWAYIAGGDPVKLIEKYGSRWVSLHVKDVRPGAARAAGTSKAPATDNVPVGSGEIDWKAVLAAAQKAGVQHYIIEDETSAPVDNIPVSAAYLRGLKL